MFKKQINQIRLQSTNKVLKANKSGAVPLSSSSESTNIEARDLSAKDTPTAVETLPPQPQTLHGGVLLFWLCLLGLSGGVTVGAMYWLTLLPPTPMCEEVASLSTDTEKLYCAQQAAQTGSLESLVAGVNLVKNWSKEHPRYSEAQSLLTEWSKAIFGLAYQKVAQNDLETAIEMAGKIPSTSSIYADVQNAIANWKENRQEGQGIYDTIQAALKAQDWQQALDQVQELSRLDNDYWRQRLPELRQQISIEKQARAKLNDALNLAQFETVADLKAAISVAQSVNSNTYARPDAQAEIVRWSRILLNLATAQLQAQDLAGAIAAAEAVPTKSALGAEAGLLMQLVQTQQLVTAKPSQQKPIVGNLFWEFLRTVTVFRLMDSEYPLYATAQGYLPTWENQVQDLVQLQMADSIASWGYTPALWVAIDYAQTVGLQRPQRLQAQTRIAKWRKDIQRIEDRPYLLAAKSLATAGTLAGFRAAILQAGRVSQGRALHGEAQTAIAQWTRQIQTIEDKPLINQAKVLAQQGKLREAIKMAERIRSGRALYGESQKLAGQWLGAIQIAEDQPLLSQARILASQGNLTGAINAASQIAPGRALYSEAQGAIASWTETRDAILRERAAELAIPNAEESTPAENSAPPANPVSLPEDWNQPPPDEPRVPSN